LIFYLLQFKIMLPWVALGTATPFILGYRVVGNEVLSSQAPKYISQSVTRAEMYEMGMTVNPSGNRRVDE
jgi:hypothetical protein